MKRVAFLILFLMSILVIWWQIERVYWEYFTPVSGIICGEIIITNPDKKVCAGSLMSYSITWDKKQRGACVIKRQLINSYLIPYDSEEPPEKPLGKQVILGKLHVPKNADPGDHWFMRWSVECPVGPYNKIIPITKDSERFVIVDCRGK
jgi:hypothetical protein